MEDFRSETYLIEYTHDAPQGCTSYFEECLEKSGFIVKKESCFDRHVISLTVKFETLAVWAEKLQILKELKDSRQVAEFFLEDLSKYNNSESPASFFVPSEQLYIMENILNSAAYDKEMFLSCGIKKFGASESILQGCLHSKPQIVESYTPMHCEKDRAELWKRVRRNPLVFPQNDIRNYYGEEIAFYIAWMNFFSYSLMPIAVYGIVLFFHRPQEDSADDSPYLPFYALLMALWTIYFTKAWRRRESELALMWNTSDVEKAVLIRPEFYGDLVTSPITGLKEKYYPEWKRRVRYLLSFLLTLPFLVLGVGAMILSLNLNGYIKSHDSPIYIASLERFAEPGQIFAADSPYYGWMVPTIGHSIVINLLNRLYRTVAEYATKLENQKTEYHHSSSLIVKRVLFELFDCYLPLFYIAFYQLDIVSLRRELVGLFWGDEIRRLATEAFIPFLLEKGAAVRLRTKIAESKKSDGSDSCSLETLENVLLEEYEQFDDYIEMVVQFGYVTLFASAFPLCSAITILFVFVEARSDMFKLLFLYRRPVVHRAKNIGVWFQVLTVMMVLSMVSNCFLFGFASEQLAVWVPNMYETYPDGDQWIKPGYGRYVVGIVFTAEHILILFVVLAHYFVHDKPKHVKIELARREYLKTKRAKQAVEKAKTD